MALPFVTKKYKNSLQMRMRKQPQSIESKVLKRIIGKGEGWVFTPRTFTDLGARPAIAQSLLRLKQNGTIRQLGRGLYDYPRVHPKLGTLTPSIETVAEALKGSDLTRLQPSGAYAANLLGLSTQVPVQVLFLTDGPSRQIVLGKQKLQLKRTTPRNMATAGKITGLVIQALRHLGQRNVDDSTVRILQTKLSPEDKNQLLKDTRYAPEWIAAVMRRVAGSLST